MPKSIRICLVVSGSILLASCSTSSSQQPSNPPEPGHTPQLAGRLPSDMHLFTKGGSWVAPRNGTYAIVAVGGGGGGGGAGSACSANGTSDQVGGAGGASGAVTMNDVIAITGQRFTIKVGLGGTPGFGGAANCGSGTRGGPGGTSSFQGFASADGGSGGAASPGNSIATVLNPVAGWRVE